MRFSVVSYHLPEPEGTPAGRILLATCEGLLGEGHEVDVVSWRREPPASALPAWCRWVAPRDRPMWVSRVRSLVQPRREVVDAGIPTAGPGAIAVADEFLSSPAIARHPRSVVTFHYSTRLDAAALGRRALRDVQDRRAERTAVRRARLTLAYSERVGTAIAPGAARAVPVAFPVPGAGLAAVDAPVAALVANWWWPPNRWALERLLGLWPAVRAAVPAATLLLAGRGLEAVGSVDGVSVVGPVTHSADVLGRAAVVVFPCPPTSGPKIKTLEALAHGLPVVTTLAGVEGVAETARAGAVVASIETFAAELAALLRDPERRSSLGAAGRSGMATHHAPRPAARARVAVIRAQLDDAEPTT